MIYLGHEISKEGIWTNEHMVEAIRNWSIPNAVTELWSFLGFTIYYCCFIKGYAKVAHPLHDQISEDNATHKKKWVMWMEECQEAFGILKVLCTPAPILAFADFIKPFKLQTDTSILGWVLSSMKTKMGIIKW